MSNTIGYHYVKSCYGLWLPGDERGTWSEKWDEEIGFTEPHMLHFGDPVRLRMAEERMKHKPLRLTSEMIDLVVDALSECAAESPWKLVAASIEATHMHLIITYSGRDIEHTVKWLAQCMTKAVHKGTTYTGPVWCKGKWCSFIYHHEQWRNTITYVERHNIRRGVGPRPYAFLSSSM